MLYTEVITYNLWEVITLNIDITQHALNYIDKMNIKSLIIDLTASEINPG